MGEEKRFEKVLLFADRRNSSVCKQVLCFCAGWQQFSTDALTQITDCLHLIPWVQIKPYVFHTLHICKVSATH